MSLTPVQARRWLAVIRFTFGAGGWLAPRPSARLLGIDPDANPSLPPLARVFASRDVALGAGVLGATGEDLERWLRIGVAVDAADIVTVVAARAKGQLSTPGAVAGLVTAAAALGLGLVALGED